MSLRSTAPPSLFLPTDWELVEKARKWDNLMKLLEADKK